MLSIPLFPLKPVIALFLPFRLPSTHSRTTHQTTLSPSANWTSCAFHQTTLPNHPGDLRRRYELESKSSNRPLSDIIHSQWRPTRLNRPSIGHPPRVAPRRLPTPSSRALPTRRLLHHRSRLSPPNRAGPDEPRRPTVRPEAAAGPRRRRGYGNNPRCSAALSASIFTPPNRP